MDSTEPPFQASNEGSSLSLRGAKVAHSAADFSLWDVVQNLWDPKTNPGGYVNVGIAENSLMHDVLLDYINKTSIELPGIYLTYNEGGTGSSRLKNALSRFLNKQLKPVIPIEPSHVLATNGCSTAIEHLSWTFTDPGEGILLGRPYYGMFIQDIVLRPGAVVVPVDFNGCDPLSLSAVQCYETALLDFQQRTGKRVRALMLCHPHNPLGRCYSPDVLISLMKLCQKYKIHFISDEIYALTVWKNDEIDTGGAPTTTLVDFRSALSIDLSGIIDPRYVHVLWGMSKDFGANGLRVGVVVSQGNTELHSAFQDLSVYSYVSGLSDHITSKILEDEAFTDMYILRNREKLAAAYSFAARFIGSHGIEYARGVNAAFFLWVNLGKKYLEIHPERRKKGEKGEEGVDVSQEVMQALLKERVFLASGMLFGSEMPGWFRIVFSHPREYLEEALNRIVRALEG